jgi:hypothetical protein
MSIFGRLGYDAANTANLVTPFSANVAYTMNVMPSLLSTWQTEDAANNDVGGYFQNPVGTVNQQIWSVANSIITVTNISSVGNLSSVLDSANNLANSSNSFFSHTNRLSGVSGYDLNNPTLPTYKSAIGISKVIMMIVAKSDNIQNNAPMMGCFTSLTVNDELTTKYNVIINYPNVLTNSINTITNTTNLTPTQTATIVSNLNGVKNLMDSRRNGDVNFYYNSQSVVHDFNQLKQFTNPGQTELYLINNYIGTDKLKTRINS